MHASVLSPSVGSTRPIPLPQHRSWAVKCLRTIIFCALFSLILLPEFGEDANIWPVSLLYAKVAGRFRFIDLAIGALVLPHFAVLACSRNTSLHLPRQIMRPLVMFLICVAGAICFGILRGGTNLFFDWRALALGLGIYVVWALWMQKTSNVSAAVQLFTIYMAAQIGILCVRFVAGYHHTLLGVAIPLYDGPAISAMVFTALLALSRKEVAGGVSKTLWTILAGSAALAVLLCFRRTYWGELAIGAIVLLSFQRGHRVRTAVLLVVLTCCVMGLMGKPFADRVVSFNFTAASSEAAADNADHVNDLQDAWDQIRQSPIMGIGVGTSYPTWRIRNWKSESVMVHNAPLHVWLKYGALGLCFYLWLYTALLRWLFRRSRSASSDEQCFLNAAFAYLAAQFAMTLGFAPWPYSELQMTTLISFILAGAFATSTALTRHFGS